jgi:hypothetical protein
MDTIIELFGANSTVEALYWMIASIGTGALGIKGLLALFGIDADHDLEFDINGDDVSVSAIVALLAVAGWTGVLGFKMTALSSPSIVGISLLSGSIGFYGSVVMFNKLRQLESKGNLELENAIGQIGQVHLGIAAKRAGSGQVQVIVQGRLATLDAETDGDRALKTGEKCLIYAVDDHKLLVDFYEQDPMLNA